MAIDIPPEVTRATPGVAGALAALIWFKGSPWQRITAFFGGASSSFYGGEVLATLMHLESGFAGFLVGLFGMAVAAKVFDAIEQFKVGAFVQRLLRRFGL